MSTSRSTFLGLPSWLIVIAVMSAIGPVTIDMYLPAFPMIEAEFGEPGAARTMASYLAGLALGQLLYGPISDRFGRKPPLYFGFVIYSLGSLGCALSSSMTMLMLFRIVQAMGGCAGFVIGRAIVRDRCEPEQAARAFSTLMAIVSIAPIVAPVAGGFVVGSFGWRATFFIQAALGMVLLASMHWSLDESLRPEHRASLHPSHVLSTYAKLLKDRSFLGYSVVGAFGFAALFSYVAGAPTILPTMYGVPPETFGWLIGVNGIAFMTASRLNLRALRKHKSEAILARFVWLPPPFAFALIAVGVVSVWWFTIPLWLTLLLQFGFFITIARMLPNVTALALAPRVRDAGAASALLGAVQSVASMLTGAAIAVFNDGTFIPLGIIMTLSVLVSVGVYEWQKR